MKKMTIPNMTFPGMAFSRAIALCLALAACTKNDKQNSVTGSQQDVTQQTPSLIRLSTAGTALTTPFTTAYVEVNSNSFHNPGCFTYGSPAKQVFGFAVIFAANINDSSNGQAELYFNPQVYSTLLSGNVAYLQSLGIKVLLSVLGNHEGAGWSCFTSYNQADSFAIQCENAVTKYGLNGIDIDDEYSTCTTNTSSLVLAVSALRSRLGTAKYITKALFDDIQYFSATYNGKTAGQILDYGWEMTYGDTDYSGRMTPYVNAGMAKTKLLVGLDIGGTDETTAAKFVKKNGYAGVMTYNISTTSQTNLSDITTVLFGSATNVTANCLQ
jgi:Glycosyl hydrolases family 18